jgi:DNA-binding MarR family transcriptional regulator
MKLTPKQLKLLFEIASKCNSDMEINLVKGIKDDMLKDFDKENTSKTIRVLVDNGFLYNTYRSGYKLNSKYFCKGNSGVNKKFVKYFIGGDFSLLQGKRLCLFLRIVEMCYGKNKVEISPDDRKDLCKNLNVDIKDLNKHLSFLSENRYIYKSGTGKYNLNINIFGYGDFTKIGAIALDNCFIDVEDVARKEGKAVVSSTFFEEARSGGEIDENRIGDKFEREGNVGVQS